MGVGEWDTFDFLPSDGVVGVGGSVDAVVFIILRIIAVFVFGVFFLGRRLGLDLERAEVRKAVRVELSICKRITRRLGWLFEGRGGEGREGRTYMMILLSTVTLMS